MGFTINFLTNMKHLSILLFIATILACKDAPSPVLKRAMPSVRFDWLNGHWQRSNDEPGQMTYEQWQKTNDSLYIGLGYTMKGQDTIWRENIKLMKADSSWVYAVTGISDTKTTDFILTHITELSFTCENQGNEFPKKIDYTLQGDSIKATISGGGPDISFLFGKINHSIQ
jgi:hypothetical protein